MRALIQPLLSTVLNFFVQVFSYEPPGSHDEGDPDPFQNSQIPIAAYQEHRLRCQGTAQKFVIIRISTNFDLSPGFNQVDPFTKNKAPLIRELKPTDLSTDGT